MRGKIKGTGFIFATIGAFALLTGCQSMQSDSAEKLVSKAIDTNRNIGDFEGKATYEMNYPGGRQLLEIDEYASKDGRMKTVIHNDGNDSAALIADGKLTVYDEKEKTAMEKKSEDKKATTGLNARDQVVNLLKTVKGTHSSKLKGQTKLHGREVNHIVLQKEQDDAQIDEMEVWLDKKTSIPLKMKAKGGKSTVQMEYTKANFAPEFKADAFKLDIPRDIDVQAFQR